MKNGKVKRFAHRALSMLLAVLTVMPAGVLTALAADDTMKTTQTKIVVWDWIDDMQKIGAGADYDPANESKNIPVGETKYSRIMFYQNVGGDRYYFNADPDSGTDSGYYSSYEEDKIYVDGNARVGNSVHKEWNNDMIAAEGGGSFLTTSGLRTPYIQYGNTKEGYQCWRLWAANKDDSWSSFAVMQVDDYEDLDVRRTDGFAENATSHYGASNTSIRADCWIIDKKFTGAAAANYKFSFDNFTIWHWDNDAGGYNEAMDFDVGDRKFKTYNAGRNDGVEEFKIFLGKEYKVSTLAENYTVAADQTQTLGKPLYYIPKGKTITVESHGTLVIDGVLLNDGEIIVKPGGLLMLKDGAKIFPLTKYDNDCGKIYSTGDIIIGSGAVLCGGANNGIKIDGGGVVNFGVLCGEYIQLDKNDLVDNRVADRNQGGIIAGKSLTGAARSRYVKAALLNEDTAKMDVNVNTDFATLNANSDGSKYITQKYSVYGDGAANVDTSGVGKTTIGSASNPTLSVYYADVPGKGKNGTALFKDEMLDEVSLRVSGTKAIYTVRGTEHTVENALISAEIGRGAESQTLFKDMWVGKLAGAYVQLEPASAMGTCLAASGTGEGANVQLGKRDMTQTVKGQWWKLTEAGKDGVNQTYRLESYCASGKSLDLPGNNSAPNNANVQIWTTEGDTGTDRRWLLTPDAYNADYYFLRNAANTKVSMEADGTEAGANVKVATNAAYTDKNVDRQRWTFVNLFDEESYGSSLTEAAAMEIIPQNATTLRLDLGGAGTGASARVSTADSNRKLQRWELRQAGADNVNGKNTPYFRVVNKESGKALTVNGEYKNKTGVLANTIAAGTSAKEQYWYLESAGGANQYYLKSRGNGTYALTATGTSNGSAVQISAWVKGEKSQMWELTGGSAVVNQTEQQQKQAESDPFYGKVFEMETDLSKYRGIKLVGSSKESYVGKDYSLRMDDRAVFDFDIHKWSFKYAGKDNTGSYYQIVPAEGNLEVAIGLASGQKMEHKAELALVASDPNDKTQLWRMGTYTDWEGTFYDITPVDGSDLELAFVVDTGASEEYDLCIAKHYDVDINSGGKYCIYQRVYWKLTEAPPLDGKTYSIVSVGYEDGAIIPYAAGAAAQSSYTWVSKGSGNMPKAYWKLKWNKTVNNTPYYEIISVYNNREMTLRDDDLVADTSFDGQVFDSWLWAVHANEDGTVSFIPYQRSWKAAQVNKDDYHGGYYTINVTSLGSTPTDAQKWKMTEINPNYDALDGKVFYLSPKHDSNLTARLDVESYSVSNGTKLVLWEKREHESQRWKFECVGTASQEGETIRYYAIHSVYSPGKALDNGDSTENNTRCTVWDYTADNMNQQWILKEAGSGYYYIIPRANATKALACAGSGTSNGTAVTIYDNNGQEDIKWKLEESMAPVELGTFEVEVVGAEGWTMDVYGDLNDAGADIQIFPAHERDYTRWTFIQMGTDGSGDPYYKIVNKGSGKVLDVSGSASDVKEGAPIKQANYDFGTDQLWYLDKAGTDEQGDYYYIRVKASWGYKLSVLDAKYEKNQHINLTSGTGDNAKWRLKTKDAPVSLGIYEFGLTEPAYAHMRLELDGSAGAFDTDTSLHTVDDVLKKSFTCPGSGAWAKIYYRSGEADQAWQIVQRGKAMYNGEITPYYSIESVGSKLALDLAGTASDAAYDGAWVKQNSYDGYPDQHWFMEIRGDNSVVFRNRVDTELVLAADGKSDGDYIKVENYDDKKSTTQRWFLHPVALKNSEGLYYVPGNAAAAEIGIPFVQDQDVAYDPAVSGNYTLAPMHKSGDEGLRLDRANGGTGNGTTIQTYTNSGSNGQKWQLIPMGVDFHDGGSGGRLYYKLAAPTDKNQVAETSGHSVVTADMAVRMYEYDGGYDQQWYLEEVGGKDNTFYLIGRGTLSQAKKICIGVPSGSAQKETYIKTATKSEKTYQQWLFDPVD